MSNVDRLRPRGWLPNSPQANHFGKSTQLGAHDVWFCAAGRLTPIPGSADKRYGQFLQLLLDDFSFTPERNACPLTIVDAGGVDFVRSFYTH